MKRKLLAGALGLLAVISGAVWYLFFPLGLPIYLVLPGQEAPVERRICAAWYPPGSGEWWLVAERGGPLLTELRTATWMRFEIDVGSGLSDVKLGREEPYQSDPSTQALYAECSCLLVPKSKPSRLVAIHLERRN
jgi:hypothetical protein